MLPPYIVNAECPDRYDAVPIRDACSGPMEAENKSEMYLISTSEISYEHVREQILRESDLPAEAPAHTCFRSLIGQLRQRHRA